MDNYQNQLAQWLKMYDDQGLGSTGNENYRGLPVYGGPDAVGRRNIRMNWALERLGQGQGGYGGMPDFWGMQTGQMGNQQGPQSQYAPPTRNWLTKMGG